MKSKMKLNKKVIQQFFIDHTEKFIFGALFLLFAWLVYGSIDTVRTESCKSVPANLQDSVRQATANVDAGPRSNEAKPAVMLHFNEVTRRFDKDFATTVRDFQKDVDAGQYAISVPFYRNPVSPRRLRDMPHVIQARELRAVAGRGAVAFLKPHAGGNGTAADDSVTHGVRWIVVTGLVPVREQAAEFKNVFEGATYQGPNDEPVYAGFYVEREEVGPGASGPPKWSRFFAYTGDDSTTLNVKERPEDVKDWADEVAEPSLAPAELDVRLPRRTDGQWGAEAVHPPKIKMASRSQAREGGPDVSTDGPPPSTRRQPRGGERDGGRVGRGPAMGHGIAGAARPVEQAEFRLLRFADFDVEPEKQYRYRVFLVLKNPNFIDPESTEPMDPAYLSDPAFGKPRYLGIVGQTKDASGIVTAITINESVAKWSEPSPLATIPEDIRLLASTIKAPKNAQQEPGGKVDVTLWVAESGVKAYDEFDVVRGSLADFPDCTFKLPNQNAQPQPGPREHGHRAAEAEITVNYLTHDIILDMNGGAPITPAGRDKTLTRPGQILVMNKSGNLEIHDEVEDQREYEAYKKSIEEAAAEPAPPGAPPPRHAPPRNLLDNLGGEGPRRGHGGR